MDVSEDLIKEPVFELKTECQERAAPENLGPDVSREKPAPTAALR